MKPKAFPVLKCDSVGPCSKQDQYESEHHQYNIDGHCCVYCGTDLRPYAIDSDLYEMPNSYKH